MKKLWKVINENLIASGVFAMLVGTALLKAFDKIFSLNIFSSIIGFANQEWIVHMWGLALIAIIPICGSSHGSVLLS